MKRLIILLIMLFGFSSVAAANEIYTGIFSNKAVSGYDTVSYFTKGKAVKGNNKWHVKYKGADWYFSSEENLNKFKSAPDAFAPQYGGHCAWAISAKNDLVSGDPKQWAIVDGKLYLNYDAEIKAKWDQDRERHILTADKNWMTLIQQQ
ncbi:YHS domain-containing (seleno)protein [Shewanella sp. YIC-542]|uniref:YHS domain-containing (seleno)protein n=1 Tax=Shewanella mytili TaxID=3377111 RepID=UPI00398F1D97